MEAKANGDSGSLTANLTVPPGTVTVMASLAIGANGGQISVNVLLLELELVSLKLSPPPACFIPKQAGGGDSF
jgi:hypothetical protein